MTRLASFVVVVLFQIHRLTNGYLASELNVQGDVDKALFGYSFLNISGVTMVKCIEHCLSNCRCLSFQMCTDSTAECQLCSSNKHSKPKAMRQITGCTNYNFGNQDKREISNQQCARRGCTTAINCCMTSNPCLNGGRCLPPSPNSLNRLRCQCPDDYAGQRCEQCKPGYTGDNCKLAIKSCRGYSNGSRVSGNYTVLDVNMKPFKVFCDFDNNSSMTWTLIQSYKLKHNNIFSKKPFSIDSPENEHEPSWSHYRLSKLAMESIQKVSTKWRITCRYESDGVNNTDYVRALNKVVNILTFHDEYRCIKVEYMNVRGQHCTNCTAGFWQSEVNILHFDSYHTSKCDFKPLGSLPCTGNLGEDNFGLYRCKNNKHRCSSSPEATRLGLGEEISCIRAR